MRREDKRQRYDAPSSGQASKIRRDREEQRHPHLRRQTAVYKQKQSLVKDIWISPGVIIIFMPLSIQMTMLLGTVFLSFCILDETEDI